jgi:hypothetical protein
MDDYNFQERDINSYVQKLKDVFNIISLTRKYKVIGSSNLKNFRYNSDFDLADFDLADLADLADLVDLVDLPKLIELINSSNLSNNL